MRKVVMPGPLTPEEIEEVGRLNKEIGDPPWEGERLEKAKRAGELLKKAKSWFEPPPSN